MIDVLQLLILRGLLALKRRHLVLLLEPLALDSDRVVRTGLLVNDQARLRAPWLSEFLQRYHVVVIALIQMGFFEERLALVLSVAQRVVDAVEHFVVLSWLRSLDVHDG